MYHFILDKHVVNVNSNVSVMLDLREESINIAEY